MALANFAYSTVATAPSPATSGTSLTLASGGGALMPAVPFNATVWPIGAQPLSSNAEIVTVTAISTDTLTITRAQEGTSARTIVAGDQFAATITKGLIQSLYLTICFSPDTTNPVDATTYYWSGQQGAVLTTTANANYGVDLPAAVTLKSCTFSYLSTAVASSETGTLFLRKNNSTNDTISSSVAVTGQAGKLTYTGLNISYAMGDYIYPGFRTPTWATNPTNWRSRLDLMFVLT